MLVHLTSEFKGADGDSIQARIIRVLLSAKGGISTAAEKILRRGAREPGRSR
jgi:hypothetical protein